MKPNIIHNKLHPTDYDRIAFIEDHYEELKEMYMTIMEHLKVPANSGGNGVNIITNTITTTWYVRIDVSYFINSLTDTEKEIFRQNCKLLVKAGGQYASSYPVVLGIYEDNYLCFPVPESKYNDQDSYQFKVIFRPNIDNITICRTDWRSIDSEGSSSDIKRYSDFTLGGGDSPGSYVLSQDSETSSILGSLPEKVFTEYYTTDIGKVGYSDYFYEY